MTKDFEDGVWRTVGGRRIFIRDGEDLASAMKKSGKFTRKKDIEHQKRKINNELAGLTGEDKKQADEEYDAYDKLSKMSDQELKEKYMSIPEEERVKAYEEGKNWKDLVKENDEKLTQSGERDKRTITKKEMEEDFNKKVKQDPELSRQTEQARAELKARDEKARVLYQKGEIEKASGLEVKNAWETDLYGNGREHRFELSDGRIVAHTLESFGQEDDTWSIGKGSDRKSYKSYSDMMKDLESSKSSSNTPYKKAFEEYKKKHPNSKISYNKFVDMSEGK